MDYITGTKFKYTNSVVTLGKFDGLHIGHQKLIDLVCSYKEQGLTSIMFSFLLHPSNLLSEREVELIFTEEEKLSYLRQSGIDVLISYPFTKEIKTMEPDVFIREILVEQLDAKVIVVGTDFHFGKNREGDVTLLRKYEKEYGYQVIACEKTEWNQVVVSSSRIRKALEAGELHQVNAMLGHPYSIRGEVVHGRKLGRTIGMPTTNQLPPTAKLLPPCGVYSSKTRIDGKLYPGVTNIGYKPTVGEMEKLGVETYIFDFDEDLYGNVIEVELYTFLRPELKFSSIEELVAKMKEDIIRTKNEFSLPI